MEPRKNFCHMVKTEPEELASQPVSKKAKKESSDLDYSLARHVKEEIREQILQDPNDPEKEQDTKCKVKEESPSRKHVEEHVKQEYTAQEPGALKKEEDTKPEQYVKSEQIQNSIASNLLKEIVDDRKSKMMKNSKPLYEGMVIRDVETLIRQVPAELDLPVLIHSRWKGLTEEETFRQEIWQVPVLLGKKPSEADLDMFWRNLSNDIKNLIHNQTEKMTTFYKKIWRAVERRLNQEPYEDLLYEFAIYFCESQGGVKACFPDMTRQEVHDTCLLRYFAMPKRKKETYDKARRRENTGICMHRSYTFGKVAQIPFGENPEENHLSKEDIEVCLRRMPLTIEVEPLDDVKPVERERRQFIVRDIKPCFHDTLAKLINCWWKDLSVENNFQYEVTRAFGGAILMEDITLSWRNLRHDMRAKNHEQTRSKVSYYTTIREIMQRDLNEDVLSYFSSYFSEFENVVKTEFPGMTKVEVYDTCLLRYIAAPKKIRELYRTVSIREECKRLCNSRFGRVP